MQTQTQKFPALMTIANRPLSDLLLEIQSIYLGDSRPWVIGYSGGKDSTAVLQLVYTALQELPSDNLIKPVFVVSSDTLVETPLVVDLVKGTLQKVETAARQDKIPLSSALVSPEGNDTFWVNLIGRGYPAPTKAFRWCTERMKIDPVSRFIEERVANFGEVIVVLGSRIAESATRAQAIRKHKIAGHRLARHTTLAGAYVYTPIESWSADDVWEYLFSGPVPWGGDHQLLLELYRGSNAGECPLVIDTSTPSCGNSRFGCWVCTVVTKDKAIEGLIASGQTWLKPLHEFRELLSETTRPENKNRYRNYKRRSGLIQAASDGASHVPGPYWMRFRKELLHRLLELEKALRADERDITLITTNELHEIRRLWIQDPNEPDWEDSLPQLYREVFGSDLEWAESDAGIFTKHDADLLGELGKQYGVPRELVMKLLELELSMDGLSKRSGLPARIEQILNQNWDTLSEALAKQGNMRDAISTYDERETELQSLYEGLRQ